jgi:p70 ribosomal S6 kinase
MLYYLF